MPITTFEGTVENGQIRLRDDAKLPEHATVYVVLPGVPAAPKAHLQSPRLADSRQAADFEKQVIEEASNAEL
jgi:hypothetical protein